MRRSLPGGSRKVIIPAVNASEWKLRIGGDAVQTPVEFTLAQLKREFEAVEIAAGVPIPLSPACNGAKLGRARSTKWSR